MFKMKAFIFLSALIAASQAQTWVPIHGCEWVPLTTAVNNFTFFDSASNDATSSDYVAWKAPLFGLACNYTSNPSSPGSATDIGKPGIMTDVPCTATASDPTVGKFVVSEERSNATLRFRAYAQCAASIYELNYEGVFPLDCVTTEGGSATCVAKGNATATVTSAIYLPPMRPPPPPPYGGW